MPASHVIVIGAGRGGLAVMRRVLLGLPDDIDAAIVLLIHSAAGDADPVAHLYQETGRIDVVVATDGMPVSPGHIHVVPPGCSAYLRAPGVFEITTPSKQRTARPVIDRLFESAAAVYGKRTIGLVLTGEGDDGTNGARAIGEAGGVSLVQSVVDCEYPGMPGNVLIGDHPYQCLLIHEIAPTLLAMTTRPVR